MTHFSSDIFLAQQAAAQPAGPGGFGMFLPLIILFAIFYMILIRPQQRKEKARRKEISDMVAGKKVLFSGGIIGTVSEVRATTFMVRVAEGVILEVAKGSVIRVLPDGEATAADLEQDG